MAVEANEDQVLAGEAIQQLEIDGDFPAANVLRKVVGAEELFILSGEVEEAPEGPVE